MEVHFFSRQKGSIEFTQISTPKHPKHNTNNYIEVTEAVRASHRRTAVATNPTGADMTLMFMKAV
jgi:hypothetical protein